MRVKEKLYFRWLWFKHFWRYNFAHKPLCNRFHQDVLHLAGVYVCRSCTFAYAGIVLFLSGLLLLEPHPASLLVVYSGLLTITLSFSLPYIYKKLHRLIRDILRCFMGGLISMTFYIALYQSVWTGVGGAILILLFWRYYYALRKATKLNACNHCPEYQVEGICSGFTMQADAIRIYEAEATEWRMKQGYVPAFKKRCSKQ